MNGAPLFQFGDHGFQLFGRTRYVGIPQTAAHLAGDDGTALVDGGFLDWYFDEPAVSVLGTLIDLQELAVDIYVQTSNLNGYEVNGDETRFVVDLSYS
ncbi:hypothetical protein [Microbacterium sp.]|uniref:hypothetical protein n=1 Tax=Microbacterium sp. TaxID=51671 RepID=UPI003C212D85